MLSSLVRRTLFVCALGATAATGMLTASDAMAQSTTRPEFNVGMPLTAKVQHSLPGNTLVIKSGEGAKVSKVYSQNGKILYLDVTIGTTKIVKVPVATVREKYNYPKM